jgi:hypothetical protein
MSQGVSSDLSVGLQPYADVVVDWVPNSGVQLHDFPGNLSVCLSMYTTMPGYGGYEIAVFTACAVSPDRMRERTVVECFPYAHYEPLGASEGLYHHFMRVLERAELLGQGTLNQYFGDEPLHYGTFQNPFHRLLQQLLEVEEYSSHPVVDIEAELASFRENPLKMLEHLEFRHWRGLDPDGACPNGFTHPSHLLGHEGCVCMTELGTWNRTLWGDM